MTLSGCAAPKRLLLGTDPRKPELPTKQLPAEPAYTISCPDIVEIAVLGRTDVGGRYAVSAEGRINLGAAGEPRVEGETEVGLVKRVAEWLDVPPGRVRCRVAEFRSRVIYLHGPVKGPPRPIPYRGPETVLSMLQRGGGLDPGAALRSVYVVRPNVARGEQPQVFGVDLPDILYRNDPTTNVVLQPFDEIYVGETRRAVIAKALPKWMLPAYHRVCWLWGGCGVELE